MAWFNKTDSLSYTHRHTPTHTQWQTGNFRFAFFCVIFQNRLHFYFYTNFLQFVVAVVFSVNCSCVTAIARIHEDRQTNAHTDSHTHTYNKTQCLSQSAKTLRKYFEKFSERLRWPPAACKSWNERCTKLTFIYSFQLGFLFSFSMRALPKKTSNNNNKSSSNQFEGFCERVLKLSFRLCELLFRCENS